MARTHTSRVLWGGTLAVCLILLLGIDAGAQGFVPKMKTFVITGSTVEPGVILGGFPGGTRIESDGSGGYRAEVPFGWKGTITPQKPGFSFTPPSIPYAEGVKADLTNQDYTPQPKTFVISGSVGMAGVTLSGFPESVLSDEKALTKPW